jgi:hypothetical protein
VLTHTFIRFKAGLLLMIFTFNVIIGMGCPFGLCICGNSHCKERELINLQPSCLHDDSFTNPGKSKDCNDDCCNDNMIKLLHFDKSCPACFTGLNGKLFISFISSFYSIDILHICEGYSNTRYYVRNHHPPIQDIRIAIQSFQI